MAHAAAKRLLPSPVKRSELAARIRRAALICFLYALTAWLLHGAGHNLWRYLISGGDGYTAGLPSKLFSAGFSPWNPFVQLGQYAFANTQFQAFYPPGLLAMLLFRNTLGYNLFILGHYVLAGWFFYLFARALRLNRYAAFFGGLCFLCSGFMMAHKGHQAMMSTAVWLPLMLLFVHRFAEQGKLRDIALAAVALAMSILGGFPQMTVYGLILVVSYMLYRCFRGPLELPLKRRLTRFGVGLIALAGLTFLCSSLQLLAVAEALPYMTRSRITLAMFNEDALPIYHLLALFVPNILGGLHGIRTYSSDLNVVEVYFYLGLAPLALALFAVTRQVRSIRDTWFWACVAGCSAILALGLSPLQRILYDVPIYNLFRAPSRHVYELNFAIAVLATFGLDTLLRTMPVRKRRMRRSLIWACATLAFAVAAVLMCGEAARFVSLRLSETGYATFNPLVTPIYHLDVVSRLIIANLKVTSPTVYLPILFLAITCIVLLTSFRLRSGWVFGVLLPIVLVADVGCAFQKLYDTPDTTDLYGADRRPETAFLRSQAFDPLHYRIYPVDRSLVNTYPLLNMMYGLPSINDYTPMWLRRYQKITRFQLNGSAPVDTVASQHLMSVLGVRYILAREPTTEAFLRSNAISSSASASNVPLPPLTCAALNCTLAKFGPGDTISLVAPGGVGVSVVNFPVNLAPSTYYRIDFDARSAGESDSPLNVDMYASKADRTAYWSPARHRSIAVVGTDFHHNTILLDSGADPPSRGYVRFFTKSERVVQLRDIHIGVLPTRPPMAYTPAARTTNGIAIFQNSGALPRFRFVTDLIPARDVDDAGEFLLYDASFDPARQATVEGLSQRTIVAPGRILGEAIASNRMRWEVQTGERSFFVVGDSWFPGWTATVDRKPVEIQIVNGFTRGIMIEGPGRHTIEMKFWPWSLTYGILLTLVGVVLVTGLVTKELSV